MKALRPLGASIVLLAVATPAARQAPDARGEFVQALARFSLALEGAYGDEGERILATLDAMERALARWDETIAGYEAAMAAERPAADARLAARMHLALGGVYLDRGRVQDAVAELSAASALDPSRPDVHTLIGLARSQLANDIQGAIAPLRTASELDPRDPARAYMLALHLLRGGDAEGAREAFARFRDNQRAGAAAQDQDRAPFPFIRLGLVPETAGLEPFFPPVRYAGGFARLLSGDYRQAILEFRAAAAGDPLVTEAAGSAAVQSAAASFRDGAVRAAAERLRAAVAAQPQAAEPRRLLGLVYAADGDYGRATTELEAAVRLSPDEERPRVALANVLTSSGDAAGAARLLRDTIDRLPTSGLARYMLARVYEQQGERPEALDALRAAAGLNPMLGANGIYETIGRMEAARQDFEAAADAYLRRVEIHPNDPDAHHDLGDIYLRQGRHDEALAEFIAALMLNPDLVETHAAMAQIHLREARFPEAMASSRRAIALAPSHEQARYTLATALIRSGQPEEGKKELAAFQRLQAESAAARSRMFEAEGLKREAALATAAGDHEKAVALLHRVFVLQPSAASSHLELGLAHLRAGQYTEAIDRLRTAAVLDPTPDVHRHLADAYAATGQAEDSAREMAAYDRLKREALRRRSAAR